MSQDSNNSNPFSALVQKDKSNESNINKKPSNQINSCNQKINALIENVFLITLNKTPKRQCIYMEEIAASSGSELFNIDLLEQALFERLLLTNPKDFLIPNDVHSDFSDTICNPNVISYLYESFERNELKNNSQDVVMKETCENIKKLILRNVSTSIKQPDLYNEQDISTQIIDLFKTGEDNINIKYMFLSLFVKEVSEDNETSSINSLKELFNKIFMKVFDIVSKYSLQSVYQYNWVLSFLLGLASDKTNSILPELFLDYIKLDNNSDGSKYADTLIGQLLCISIMPKKSTGPYEYFENSLDVSTESLKAPLWNYLQIHWNNMHKLIKQYLLFGGNVRIKMLEWIGNCIHANIARGQIWNTHNATQMGNTTTASDAFIIGLCAVLLRLCKPLVKPDFKVLMVDPTYCAVSESERSEKGVHLKNVDKETCLVPIEENEKRITADKYNFITECFYMAHKAIDIGYRVCIEKLIRINREIYRLQVMYQETVNNGGSEMEQNMMQMVKSQLQQFLSLQNVILEPTTYELLLQFYDASALWLSQIASKDTVDVDCDPTKGFAPLVIKDINLPLTNKVSNILKSVPEFIIENIVCNLSFSQHFDMQSIQTEAQNNIFTMILIFMGSSERVRNPHLRARLAEGLEALLPPQAASSSNRFRSIFSQNLFTHHPHRLELTPNLLKVFVGIEMTGQSVQFEQKFNYRRPMYKIMDYLFTIDEQKQCFKNLATEAEENIEAFDPPIFLRFINLLINDAIFLLDESLSNLQQIHTLQEAQDSGQWANLSANERQQNTANLQHLGMLARFDNILGRDTINILKLLTSEIKGIFCHTTIVDRVASMLNYFLLHLVGPKKANLKVKDKKEFEFDPAKTVLEICHIYINLQESDAFCLAVSQEGRSYSPQLFQYADKVLMRINGGQLIGEMLEFSMKVCRLEQQQKEDQQALIDPPDEFLDPIMSTLMSDPVILPSSKVVVDRSTIARHLLSDQSDPFNRSPLTMDQVIGDTELKRKIDDWIRERRINHSNLNLANNK